MHVAASFNLSSITVFHNAGDGTYRFPHHDTWNEALAGDVTAFCRHSPPWQSPFQKQCIATRGEMPSVQPYLERNDLICLDWAPMGTSAASDVRCNVGPKTERRHCCMANVTIIITWPCDTWTMLLWHPYGTRHKTSTRPGTGQQNQWMDGDTDVDFKMRGDSSSKVLSA